VHLSTIARGLELSRVHVYAANFILFCYYMSPLATLALVLRTRNSSSLTLPLCVMNTVNGCLWLTYGLVLADPFMWVPNGVGAGLGLIQTALCIIFPRQEIHLCALKYLSRNEMHSLLFPASRVCVQLGKAFPSSSCPSVCCATILQSDGMPGLL
jgi:uncharacterized protein with PQ loop repeat